MSLLCYFLKKIQKKVACSFEKVYIIIFTDCVYLSIQE